MGDGRDTHSGRAEPRLLRAANQRMRIVTESTCTKINMEKKLEQWLRGRNLSKKILKMLVKEELVTTEVLSLLREDDIRVLSQKHSLSMGETVHLREARDAVIRGEYGGRLASTISTGTAEVEEDGVEEGQPKSGEMDSAPDVST